MGAENGDGAFGYFVQLFDEARALVLQRIHDMLVVHDLVAHIDRLAILIERLFHDIDGAHDSGTEAARLGKNNSHVRSLFLGPWSWADSGQKAFTALQHSHFRLSGQRLQPLPLGMGIQAPDTQGLT